MKSIDKFINEKKKTSRKKKKSDKKDNLLNQQYKYYRYLNTGYMFPLKAYLGGMRPPMGIQAIPAPGGPGPIGGEGGPGPGPVV